MQITRRRVIATAMDLIECEGVEALSMHRLSAALGCALVSLYSYVSSKATLLDAIADTVMSGIAAPPAGVPAAYPAPWPERIRAQAMAFRATVKTRPRCALVALGRRPSAAGGLRQVEQALATLSDAGFDHDESVRIVRALIAYVIGSVLGDARLMPGEDADDMDTRRPRLRPGEFPHLLAVAAERTDSDPDADFEFGLDLLLRSVAAMSLACASTPQQAC